jgi:hypothetical protein
MVLTTVVLYQRAALSMFPRETIKVRPRDGDDFSSRIYRSFPFQD